MRCPRCNRRLVPGTEQCFACGLSLSAVAVIPRTYPDRNRGATADLLEQRQALASTGSIMLRAWSRTSARTGLTLGNVRAALVLMPPVWVAIPGMALGAGFFVRRDFKLGAAVAGLEAALLAAIVFLARDWTCPTFLVLLLLAVVLAAGFEPVRRHLLSAGRPSTWQTLLMSGLASVAGLCLCLYVGWGIFIGLVPVRGLARLQSDLPMGPKTIPAGARALVVPLPGDGRGIQRGDLLVRPGSVIRVLAAPGDQIEVRECELWVNGEALPPELWPLDPQWPNQRCNISLPPLTAPPGAIINVQRQGYDHQFRWQLQEVALASIQGRMAAIIWPPEEWSSFP